MELELLKQTWAAAEARAIRAEAEVGELRSEMRIGQAERLRNRLRSTPTTQVVVGLLTMIVTGGFMADHAAEISAAPLSAAAGLYVFLLGLFAVIGSVSDLVSISSLDYTMPVVQAQRKLIEMRTRRLRWFRVALGIGIACWTAWAVLAAQALTGWEAYRSFPAPWIVANLAFGLACVVGLFILGSRKAEDFRRRN